MPTRRPPRKPHECLPIDNGDGTARVPLHDGSFAIIDAVDMDRVSIIAWQHRIEEWGQEYALGAVPGSRRIVRMHRLLLCFPLWRLDHIDGDGLNNRRSNLRFCENWENGWNCKKRKPGKYSRFKGVTVHKASGLWKSQLQKHRKQVHAKYHKTEMEAALAYDAAAIEHFGEFAATNATLGLLPTGASA